MNIRKRIAENLLVMLIILIGVNLSNTISVNAANVLELTKTSTDYDIITFVSVADR